MSENIFWILETEIAENSIEDLKALMKEMVDHTKATEPGAINYEWYISADNRKCTLHERYENSEAVLLHLDSFGKNYAKRFMKILTPKKFIVYGSPSDAVKNAMSPLGVIFMNSLGGFKK